MSQTEILLYCLSGSAVFFSYPDSDSRDLPIKELALLHRSGSASGDDAYKFYTFPAAFEQEIAKVLIISSSARALANAGMPETGDPGSALGTVTM